MKTTFHKKYSTGTSSKKHIALVVAVFALGSIILFFLRPILIGIVSPLWEVENRVTQAITGLFTRLRDKGVLARENLELKTRVSILETMLAAERSRASVLATISEQFGESIGKPAGVLVHPPQTPYDILIIDKGADSGIEVGNRVDKPEGGAMGFVEEVFGGESRVRLYSSSGLETAGFLERNNTAVTLVGTGGGMYRSRVPRDTQAEVGDRVFLPGLEPVLLGVLKEINIEPTDSAKELLISGVANVFSIRFVRIK